MPDCSGAGVAGTWSCGADVVVGVGGWSGVLVRRGVVMGFRPGAGGGLVLLAEVGRGPG